MNDSLYIAVDLGAGSGRVFLSGMSPSEFLLEEAHRFAYEPITVDGHLRWDGSRIWNDVQSGLANAAKRARELRRPVSSVGVDSWGTDYGLIDARGNLCENPICYRDNRTANIMEKVFQKVPQDEIFSRTGIQFLRFNTIFQLRAHIESGIPDTAVRLLLIPDLIHFWLGGRAATEYTNATTTQMVNAETGSWDLTLLSLLNFPRHLPTDIVPAGTDLGALNTSIAKETGLSSVRVIAPATHDTASAVVGTPLETGFAYISSGTWSLVGIEQDRPLINAQVCRRNFTNEGGAFGTIRFLKNVMGLWILESCRKEWRENGIDTDYENLLGQVSSLRDAPCLIFPDDPRLLNPPKMLEALSSHLLESGQQVPSTPAAWTKAILDSLALRYASVLNDIQSLTGKTICGVHIVGGGSRNDYVNQMTADITGLPVLAGPTEATVTGNILVQAIAHGRFRSLSEGRAHIGRSLGLKKFIPHKTTAVEGARCRYAAIEARWIEDKAGDLIHGALR
jgi:rhamnulokinase